jgi:hypothetical protein
MRRRAFYFHLNKIARKAMTRTLTALAAAGAMAVAVIAAPTTAEARSGRIAAGIIGGLAAGAIIGGAFASPYYYGGGPYYGYGGPVYYGGGPYYAYGGGGGCYLQRERYWDGFGWRVHRVQVCH